MQDKKNFMLMMNFPLNEMKKSGDKGFLILKVKILIGIFIPMAL